MRSISARSSGVSTMSAARAFSSRCLRDFRAGYRYNEASSVRTPDDGPSDGELGEGGLLPVRDGLERRAQPEVFLEIGCRSEAAACERHPVPIPPLWEARRSACPPEHGIIASPSSLQTSIWPCSSASRENNEYSI